MYTIVNRDLVKGLIHTQEKDSTKTSPAASSCFLQFFFQTVPYLTQGFPKDPKIFEYITRFSGEPKREYDHWNNLSQEKKETF
jgi:hypothetical protein